jgi:hypothetical protein
MSGHNELNHIIGADEALIEAGNARIKTLLRENEDLEIPRENVSRAYQIWCNSGEGFSGDVSTGTYLFFYRFKRGTDLFTLTLGTPGPGSTWSEIIINIDVNNSLIGGVRLKKLPLNPETWWEGLLASFRVPMKRSDKLKLSRPSIKSKLLLAYRKYLDLFKPPEPEEMHTITGYDESTK